MVTSTQIDRELAEAIGKALAGDPEHVVPATWMLAQALMEGARCERASRRESYPSLGPVATAVRRLADPTVPGNTARVNILIAAAQRYANERGAWGGFR
jgi:hypothetical protein